MQTLKSQFQGTRPSTSSSGLLHRRASTVANSISMTKPLVNSRMCRHDRLEALNLRRANTSMFPRVLTQRPSLASVTTNTTASGSSGHEKKPVSVCDSGQSVVVTAGAQSSDSAESDSNLSEEELERRRNIEKCLSWIHSLPPKFSSMHIVQQIQTVYSDES